jgi:hypothetical protein
VNFILYYVKGERLDYWDPDVFLAALLSGTAALVVVSLLTAPEPAPSVDSLFERLHTSSDDDTEGRPRPLLLVDALHLRAAAGGRGWRAYREDLGGFAIGWVLVFVLVIATAIFLKM